MALSFSEDHTRLYGTTPVILSRETDDGYEFHIGHAAPFGGILVNNFGGRSYVEEPYTFWRDLGFSITEPPVLEEARLMAHAALLVES